VAGLGLSLKKLGLDLDRKIWQSAHLCCRGRLWNLRADCSIVGLYCI